MCGLATNSCISYFKCENQITATPWSSPINSIWKEKIPWGRGCFSFFLTYLLYLKCKIVLIRAVDQGLRVRGSHRVSHLVSSLMSTIPARRASLRAATLRIYYHVEAGSFRSKRGPVLGNLSRDTETPISWFPCCMTAKRAAGVSW